MELFLNFIARFVIRGADDARRSNDHIYECSLRVKENHVATLVLHCVTNRSKSY